MLEFLRRLHELARTNIDDLLREEWIDKLIEMGVLYTGSTFIGRWGQTLIPISA